MDTCSRYRATVRNLGEVVLAPIFLIGLERAVVRCNGSDIASLDAFPESLLAFFAFHWRRTYEVPSVWPLVNLIGEMQVLGTCLSKDGISFVSGLCDFCHTLGIGQMYDIHGCIQALCPLDSSEIRFSFNKFGTAGIMIPGRGLALCKEFSGERIDDLLVFSVNADECTDFLCFSQNLVEQAVCNAEVVNHEDLKAGYAVFNRFGHAVYEIA